MQRKWRGGAYLAVPPRRGKSKSGKIEPDTWKYSIGNEAAGSSVVR